MAWLTSTKDSMHTNVMYHLEYLLIKQEETLQLESEYSGT